MVRTGTSASPISVMSSSPSTSSTTVPTSLSWTTHVHAWCWSVRPLGDGEVHPDRLPVQLFAIHHLPRLRRIVNRLEIDERESSAAAGVTVQDDLTLLDAAEGAEVLLELPLRGVEAQAKHPETLIGLRGLALIPPTASSTSSVSSTAG